MAHVSRLLQPLRTLHLYLGVFFAPALLFLALTGALQSLDLHEPSRASGYQPPTWLVRLSHLHKKQSLELPVRRGPPRAAASAAGPTPAGEPTRPEAARRNLWPMKIFFLLVALSLMASVGTGLYMGWRHAQRRGRWSATLAAGVVVPALLMLF